MSIAEGPGVHRWARRRGRRDGCSARARRAVVVAAADLVAEHRGGRISAAALITRAGVTPREFFAAFETPEDCLLAGFDEALRRLVRSVGEAIPSDATLITKLDLGLCALLAFVEDEPGWARLLLLELPIAARPRRQRAISRLTHVVGCVGAEALLDTGPPLSQTKTRRLSEEVMGVVGENLASARRMPPAELGQWLMATMIEPQLAGRPAAEGVSIARINPRRHRKISAKAARSARVLRAVARAPLASNRDVARAAGVPNDSNVSAHLRRLERQGLIRNVTSELGRGKPNAWTLTSAGEAFVASDVDGREVAA